MVFGWGKKKPKLQESDQTVQTEKQITLSKIPSILEEIKNLRTKTIISEAKFFQKNFDAGREHILKIANELEKDNLKVDDIARVECAEFFVHRRGDEYSHQSNAKKNRRCSGKTISGNSHFCKKICLKVKGTSCSFKFTTKRTSDIN